MDTLNLIAIHRGSLAGTSRKTHISRMDPVKPLCGGGPGAAGATGWETDMQGPEDACSCLRCLSLAVKLSEKAAKDAEAVSA